LGHIIDMKAGHIEQLDIVLILATLTEIIETNHFQNCPIARSTDNVHVPLSVLHSVHIKRHTGVVFDSLGRKV